MTTTSKNGTAPQHSGATPTLEAATTDRTRYASLLLLKDEKEAQYRRDRHAVEEFNAAWQKEFMEADSLLESEAHQSRGAHTEAEKDAVIALQEAHASYHPDDLSDNSVLLNQRPSEEQMAQNLGLTLPEENRGRPRVAGRLAWIFTIIIGIAIGLSWGLYSGSLDMDNLFGKGMLVVLWVILGVGLAALGKFCITLPSENAGRLHTAARADRAGSVYFARLQQLAVNREFEQDWFAGIARFVVGPRRP